MIAYQYDEDRVFCGTYKCQLDPVASGRSGRSIWLVPPNTTEIAPPEFDPIKQKAIWNGQSWSIEDIPLIPESIEPEEPLINDMDRLEAQILYTAMMTDTLLEG